MTSSSESDDEKEEEEEENEEYLFPPGLETDCFDLVRAWQFRRRENATRGEEEEKERRGSARGAGRSDDDNDNDDDDDGEEKEEVGDEKDGRASKGKEKESPFQSFRLLYTERNFDRMFHLKTKFTNPNEQLQRLYDASLAIWDLANDKMFREKEKKSRTSSSLVVGALFLLFMFYRRQPRKDVFFVKRGYRDRAKEAEGEEEELPTARVYVSLKRMRELLGVVDKLEEEVVQKKKSNDKNKKADEEEDGDRDDDDDDDDDDVEAALEALAIIREMVADNAFIIGCTRPLTQRERRDFVESTKLVVKNELLEVYEEVRDEMISLENGGIQGVAALLEQTEAYGKALDLVLEQRPVPSTYAADYLDPAKKIGGAVDRFVKRLEGKLEEILKTQPKQKRAYRRNTSTSTSNNDTKELPREPSAEVVTTTVDGLTVVNTKKTTVITKKAPVSKRKRERRELLESMPDYYEKDKGNQ